VTAITVVIATGAKRIGETCLRILRRERRIRVVEVARSGDEALAAAGLRADVLLLGLDVFVRHGPALLGMLRVEAPRTKVILLIERASTRQIVDALGHGVRGYLERKTFPRFLVKAVQRVDAGEAWVPRRIVAAILDRFVRTSALAGGPAAID
jgi:two-component system nitrate/nitrite response regulator NarL